MNSIDKNQPEENRGDLRGKAAVEKIREVVKRVDSCFFCTGLKGPDTEGARPMNVRQVDDDGTLWFLSASDSLKNAEVSADPSVRLYFQVSSQKRFQKGQAAALGL